MKLTSILLLSYFDLTSILMLSYFDALFLYRARGGTNFILIVILFWSDFYLNVVLLVVWCSSTDGTRFNLNLILLLKQDMKARCLWILISSCDLIVVWKSYSLLLNTLNKNKSFFFPLLYTSAAGFAAKERLQNQTFFSRYICWQFKQTSCLVAVVCGTEVG